MTASLYDRIQENERFAADVAHELKNPLTSIRSAVETSQSVQDPAVREKMREVIARDVMRLDRLITRHFQPFAARRPRSCARSWCASTSPACWMTSSRSSATPRARAKRA